MFQSLLRSLLNHLYRYANENVSVWHLSLICITSILTTIFSLKKLFSLWKILPYLQPQINRVLSERISSSFKKKIYIFYLPAKGRSVWWKTRTSVWKMLASAYGLRQYFPDLGHSFSPYGPPIRQITYISWLNKIKSLKIMKKKLASTGYFDFSLSFPVIQFWHIVSVSIDV